MAIIPDSFQSSRTIQLLNSQKINYRKTDDRQIELESCLFCKKEDFGHLYIVIDGTNRDGLYLCHKCGVSGNFQELQRALGVAVTDLQTLNSYSALEPLPDVEQTHADLMADTDALDYLENIRGFSRDIIVRQKLGLVQKRYFRETGEVKALVYPYLVNGNCIFAHYRTLPTLPLSECKIPKAFNSPKGRDGELYNGEILRDGLKELIMVEGEANCISAMDKGIENIVGVPGANIKKLLWLDTLDKLNLEKIYICYDNDKVGEKAAQTLASKIGIDRCYKIILPKFKIITETGEERNGKDLNEYFVNGGTKESFDELVQSAQLFDVLGVKSSLSALDEFEEFLAGKIDLQPSYLTPWKSLNQLVGWENGDVIDILSPGKIGKSTMAMNIMEYEVNTYGEDGVIICLEMPVQRFIRKWVSHVTNTDDSLPKTPQESINKLQTLRNAIPEARIRASNRPGTLYFCYPQIKTADDVYKLMLDCIRRYGVQWIMFDNLQLLADRTSAGKNRTVHLSEISKHFAGIAKDNNIKMIRILQPHKIQNGQIVTTGDVDGSSQIEKDCDCMITIHRNPTGTLSQETFANLSDLEAFQQDNSFDSKMLVNVGLSRYSGGGQVVLEFDGATSTVREWDDAKIAMDKVKADFSHIETLKSFPPPATEGIAI